MAGAIMKAKWLSDARKIPDEVMNYLCRIAVRAVVEDAAGDCERADAAERRICDRYLRNRLDYLDYQGAIQQGLPIGSGEIESAHRYIIQQRLKRPGAWWSPVHVEAMLALRLNRANHEWEAYWQRAEKQAAGTGQPIVASL